jgi:AraC-like DNA-binding protein
MDILIYLLHKMTKSIFTYFQKKDAWGIEIKTCGYYNAPPKTAYPPEGHPNEYNFSWRQGRKLKGFHLVYIPTGSGIFESGKNKKWTVNAGDLILIYENEWHRYKPDPKTGWEEYWVGIDGDHFREHILKDLFQKKSSLVVPLGYREEIILAFEQILSLSKRTAQSTHQILSGSLLNLLAQVINAKDTLIQQPKESMIEDSILLIRQQLNNHISLTELADRFNMSYSGFRKFFKKQTGLPINQYIIRERLLIAQRMLRSTSLSLNEIAEKTGFESIHYFSRLFKLKFGYSPSKERHSLFK